MVARFSPSSGLDWGNVGTIEHTKNTPSFRLAEPLAIWNQPGPRGSLPLVQLAVLGHAGDRLCPLWTIVP